jgi:hypothetical protein
MEFATNIVIQSQSRDMHHVKMDQNVMRVKLAQVVTEHRDITPL